MRKMLTIAAAVSSLSFIAVGIPTGAQAQTYYYNGYSYRPYYVPRYYGGGYYSDYYRFGNPSSRNALDTCAYC